MGLVTAGVVGALVLAPAAVVLAAAAGLADGSPDLDAFRRASDAPHLAEAVATSLAFAAAATVVSLVLAVILVLLTERPGARFVGPIRVLIAIPAFLPTVVLTGAWLALLEPRVGLVNVAAGALGAEGPVLDLYSLPGMVWVEAIDGVLLPYALLVAAWRALDPALLHASRLAGATTVTTLRRVALPLMAPALAGAALLMVARGLGSFTVPAALGRRAGLRFLSTEILQLSRTIPPDLALAAVHGLVLAVATAALLALHQRALRDLGATGWMPSGGGRRTDGPRRTAADAVGLGLAVVIGLLPLLAMGWTSLQPFLRPPTAAAIAASDLDAYRWALTSPIVRRAAVNTLILAGATGAIAIALGVAVVRTGRHRPALRRRLEGLATLPIAVSGTVLAVALLWVLLLAGYDLIGAAMPAIVVGVALGALPYGVRAAGVALDRLPRVLEDASAVSGAGPATTLRRITLPVASAGLLAGALVAMTRGARALAVPAILAGPGTEVLTIVLLRLQEGAEYPEANALGVLMAAGLAVAAGAAALLRRMTGGRA